MVNLIETILKTVSASDDYFCWYDCLTFFIFFSSSSNSEDYKKEKKDSLRFAYVAVHLALSADDERILFVLGNFAEALIVVLLMMMMLFL